MSSSSEAGPSTATSPSPSPSPLFKKRGKSHTTSRISTAVIDEPTSSNLTANATTQEEEISVQDLIALRSLTRKPTGIELERLNKGEKKKKKKHKENSSSQQDEERWEEQMKTGGLMAGSSSAAAAGAGDDEESDQEDSSKARRLVRKNNFQGETGTVDVDKHMMAYIEQEMKKRTTNPSSSSSSSTLDQSSLLPAVNNPEDALYALAEKYKELSRSIKPEQTQEEREGNVALSAAMLSSIPEVDLGIDTRMKNIEDTEKAKREFYENRRNKDAKGDAQAAADDAFAGARFQRQRPRTNNSDFHHHRSSDAAQQNGAHNRGERKQQLATDQLVLDRFKKRQRNFR
ncbi:uncharacterized protein UTRI_06067_B [Ustilago trichophora]|uniref:Hepatocellular carcinoma-associated antigen 59-domain-containing protein n=1 Tax=Ustilago trichophora TaxID=86804 RepID=A0A5C3EI99_9BASI|nr:uncharacterized protein UTRI_06067_B [Ustilago trichophora]